MTRLAAAMLAASIVSGDPAARVATREVTYAMGTTTFKGYVAYVEKTKGRRPGILVVHEWWGLNDFIKTKTRELASMGYVAFAPDVYGNGRVTTDPQAAAKMAGEVRGTPLLRQRIVLAFNTLRTMENVDTQRIAAVGFCFGGTAVLELAYSGADVRGVVSFHGGLVSPTPGDMGAMKAKILVLHGADDPNVAPDSIKRLQESLRKARVDWQMVYLGNAVHGFTNPSNGNDNRKGVAYNPAAARRSWTYAHGFLKEIFASGTVPAE